jgi:hypothetical protein
MRKRIARIAPLQLGKVSAVFYAIFSIPFALIMGIAGAMSSSPSGMSLGFVILIPVFYIVVGFLFMALGAWLYNVITKWTGGIEYESEEVSGA